MLKSNLLCAFIALVTALTISSAFAHGYLSPPATVKPQTINQNN